jgi:hypothetical protein
MAIGKLQEEPLIQKPSYQIRSEKVSQMMNSPEAKYALDSLLDRPLIPQIEGLFSKEPKTLRAILDKYGVPVPTVGDCLFKLDEEGKSIRLTLPQLTGLPLDLGGALVDVVNRSTEIYL